MLKKIASPLARVVEKYLPDPLIIVIFLTLLSFVLAYSLTPHTPSELLMMWGNGLGNLFKFAMQMLLVLVCGYLLATTPVVSKLLDKLARKLNTPARAIIVTTLCSALACWLNWGFGLVVGALMAKAVARYCKVDYRVLVASAYSGFIVWHGGLSGSVPLTIATDNHFSAQAIGIVPVSETIFAHTNLLLVAGLVILLPLVNYLLLPNRDQSVFADPSLFEKDEHKQESIGEVNALEQKRWPIAIAGLLGLSYLVYAFTIAGHGLNLNNVIAIFLFLSLALHPHAHSLLSHLKQGVANGSGIIIQFPFYAGLMALMSDSGLAQYLSTSLIESASKETLPLLSFLSAGLVNVFVPSGGGQWAVQAPVVIPAAQALDVSVPLTAMAVAWGDAWTNLIQPFWAIPVLAIAGLKAKDIMGFCIIQLVITGVYIGTVLTVSA